MLLTKIEVGHGALLAGAAQFSGYHPAARGIDRPQRNRFQPFIFFRCVPGERRDAIGKVNCFKLIRDTINGDSAGIALMMFCISTPTASAGGQPLLFL